MDIIKKDNKNFNKSFEIVKNNTSKITDLSRKEKSQVAGLATAALPITAGVVTELGEVVTFSLAEIGVAIAAIPTSLIMSGSLAALESDNIAVKVVGAVGAGISIIPQFAFGLLDKALDLVGSGIIAVTDIAFGIVSTPLYFLGKGAYKLVTLPKTKKLHKEVAVLENGIKEKIKEQVKKNYPGHENDIDIEIGKNGFFNSLVTTDLLTDSINVKVEFNTTNDKIRYRYHLDRKDNFYLESILKLNMFDQEKEVGNLKNYRDNLKNVYKVIQKEPDEREINLENKEKELPYNE